MSEYTEEQARADADAILARLEADPTLRQQLIDDPHGTLIAAGLPADTVAEIELAISGAEVEGFMKQIPNFANLRATTAAFATLGAPSTICPVP